MGIQERKEREFLRREGEILTAALSLFHRENWQSVTIEEVAQAAEIGKGTIYKHFASKEDIYARLALDFNRRLLLRLREIDPGADVMERLRLMIRIFWDTHLHSPEYHRLVEYCEREDLRRNISEPIRDEIRDLDSEFRALVTSVVDQGVKEGIFSTHRPPEMLLLGAQATLFGAIRLVRTGCLDAGEVRPDQLLDVITDFILSGLTAPLPSPSPRA